MRKLPLQEWSLPPLWDKRLWHLTGVGKVMAWPECTF